MQKIDIERELRGAKNAVEGLNYSGVEPPETFKGNAAVSKLASVIYASIFGFHDQVIDFVPHFDKWMEQAIADADEFDGADGHHSRLYHGRGLAAWLKDGELRHDYWDQARILKESSWRVNKTSMREVVQWELADYMAFAILGSGQIGYEIEAYEAGVEMYEYWRRPQEISLKKTLKPYDFGYAVCQYLVEPHRETEELFAAGHKMLKANLENWLASGAGVTAATWLMIVNWFMPYIGEAEPTCTPLDALLKGYDDMPDVERPFPTKKERSLKKLFGGFRQADDG